MERKNDDCISNSNYLSDTSRSGEQNRMVDQDELLHEVSKPDRIHGGHQHLKEGNLWVILEGRDDLLPQVHPFAVKVHVAAPQVSVDRELSVGK